MRGVSNSEIIMAKFFICLLAFIMTDLALCGDWYNQWHHPHGDEKTDTKFDGTFDERKGKGDDDDDGDNFFLHEHHHHHHWHNHPDDNSLNRKTSGGKPETKCLDSSNGNVEDKKIFFGCMISKLIEQCIKNCKDTNDFDPLCGSKICTASCGIDPLLILSKVCPQANILTSAEAQTTAATIVSKTTPSVVIAVDGTSFVNIGKGPDNKTNSTNPFKTDIFSKTVLHEEEPDTPPYFKHPPRRVVTTNKRN